MVVSVNAAFGMQCDLLHSYHKASVAEWSKAVVYGISVFGAWVLNATSANFRLRDSGELHLDFVFS